MKDKEPFTVEWMPCGHDRYWEAFEVLPPIYGPNGFMVSEPHSHRQCAITGVVRATYAAFLEMGDGRYFEAVRPLTIPEFKAAPRPALTEEKAS